MTRVARSPIERPAATGPANGKDPAGARAGANLRQRQQKQNDARLRPPGTSLRHSTAASGLAISSSDLPSAATPQIPPTAAATASSATPSR